MRKLGAHSDGPTMHHGLISGLDGTCVMQNHNDAFEAFDSCAEVRELRIDDILENIPFGGDSVRPIRTMPFLTCVLRILFSANL